MNKNRSRLMQHYFGLTLMIYDSEAVEGAMVTTLKSYPPEMWLDENGFLVLMPVDGKNPVKFSPTFVAGLIDD